MVEWDRGGLTERWGRLVLLGLRVQMGLRGIKGVRVVQVQWEAPGARGLVDKWARLALGAKTDLMERPGARGLTELLDALVRGVDRVHWGLGETRVQMVPLGVLGQLVKLGGTDAGGLQDTRVTAGTQVPQGTSDVGGEMDTLALMGALALLGTQAQWESKEEMDH